MNNIVQENENSLQNLQHQVFILKSQVSRLEGLEHDFVASEDRYRDLFENAPLGYQTLNKEGIIIEVNRTLIHLLGYLQEEMTGKWFGNFVTPEQVDLFRNSFDLYSKTSKTCSNQFILIKKTGEKIHTQFEGRLVFDDEGNFKYTHCIIQDITEWVQAREKIMVQNMNLKIKDELLTNKEVELKKQNLELTRLNKELKEQNEKINLLHKHIIDNELRLKLAFEAANEGIWDWNLVTGETYYSDRFYSLLNYEPYEFPHKFDDWIKLIHPNDKDDFIREINDKVYSQKTDFSSEYRMCKKDGNYVWILSRSKVIERDDNQTPTRLIGTHMDITHQKEVEIILKQNENELKQQNELFHTVNNKLIESNVEIKRINQQLTDQKTNLDVILKAVAAAIGMVTNRTITFVNDFTMQLTGYSKNEIIGRNVRDIYVSEEEYLRVGNILYSDLWQVGYKAIQTQWRLKNGNVIDVMMHLAPINHNNPNAGIAFAATDITEQLQYQVQLIKAKEYAEKADRLKALFLANLSHEIRTPMNGIIGFTELLQSQTNLKRRDEYLNTINRSAKQLLKIISDIIEIAKIDSDQIEIYNSVVSLNSIFDDLFSTLQNTLEQVNKKNVKVIINKTLENGSDYIKIDEGKLKIILNILINNALKFTEKGNIEIGYKINPNGLLDLYVLDTGIGISFPEQEYIFDRFRQADPELNRRYGGNGLGLAIAKGYILKMDGNIRVESQLGKGSNFIVSLPFNEYKSEINITKEMIEDKEDSEFDWKNRHILVVEDDFICFALIEELLSNTNIKVTHACTGLEAVKTCKKDQSIDLVLMDMRLPEIDGYQATKIIKEQRPELPIIAQTAHAMSEDRLKCINAGCNEYMTKPIDRDILFSILNHFLDKL